MAVQRASRPQRSRSSPASGGFRGFLEGAWDRTKRIASGFGRFVRSYYFAIAFVLALLIILIGGGYLPLSFPPFETYGTIYVGSPEVYTRERLVNDRYDQDFWYRTQLRNLDQSDSLLTAYLETATRFGIKGVGATEPAPVDAAATDSNSPPTANAGVADPTPSTPFDQEFRIRAGIRDHIRQLILENMLDDRHDLTGNSIYGLKFDTTVLPGTNTYRRAFVRVAISIPEPFLDDKPGEAVPEVVRRYYDGPIDNIGTHPDEKIRESFYLYTKWLENVGLRLNEYTQVYYDRRPYSFRTNCKEKEILEDSDEFTREILGAVLNIDMGRSGDIGEYNTNDRSTRIFLPSNWEDLLAINRHGGSCQDRMPRFSVHSVADYIYLFPRSKDRVIPSGYSPLLENDEWTAAIFTAGANLSSLNSQRLHYGITTPMIEYAKSAGKILSFCQRPSSKGCEQEVSMLPVQSGFFNFVKAISATDAYVYALFPKSESVAYRSDTSLSADLSAGGGESPGVLANLFRRIRGTSSEAVFVGYVDGVLQQPENPAAVGDKAANSVQFGWVISGMGGSPVEKSSLALVSVPAWTNRLELTISVGWLDRNSKERADPPFRVIVRVPPDYEAFDSSVAEGKSITGPKIFDVSLGQVELFACQPANLVIPGSRLWRSTSVVLGSQTADRISVLPNMQGVVARFDRIDVPNTPIHAEKAASRLRVWTSEGVDEALSPISIRVPKSVEQAQACPEKDEKGRIVELGQDDAGDLAAKAR